MLAVFYLPMRDYLPAELRAERLKPMHQFVLHRGGKCLALDYVHCNVRMTVDYAVHGWFEARPRHIAAGS